MHYQNNLRIVKARFPHLLPLLKEADHTITLEIQPSKTGAPVARVNQGQRKLWLNSIYNPEAEAERWADKLLEQNTTAKTLILCGGGFLYHLKAIAKRRHFAKIVCYEPDPAILRAVLEAVDLEKLREVDFLWIGGVEHPRNTQLTSEYLTSLILEMTLEVVPPYPELYGTEISAFREKLAEWVRFNRCNLATMNLFSEQWLENYIQNLRHLSSSSGIRHFFQQFRGIPGIIVSAGPSLEKNLHLLKELRERAVIICAGTTLQAMAKQEVFPHFLALIDGGTVNKTIFGRIDQDFLKQIHLIYNGRVNWEFLNNYSGSKIYAKLDAETFSDYVSLQMQNYDFGMIKSGFSVSHTALDLADKLGCDPIVLIGQDLAYTGDKRYAESVHQNLIDRQELPRGFFITKDIYGQDIVTNREFDNFRMLFETQITENYQNKKIINATEGGLNIQGTVNRKLQEVIEEFCRVDRGISQKIESIYKIGQKAVQKYLPDRMFLTREVKTLARLGDKKAAELWDRIERLRRCRILDGYGSEQLDAELRQVSADYKSLLNIREYQLLTKDLHQAKLAANEIALQRLAGRKEIEIYGEKLRYWLNIFTELRSYFKFIIELCGTSLTQETEATLSESQSLIPSGTQLAEIVNGFRNGVSLAETGKRLEAVINLKRIEPGAHANYFYYYAMLLMKKKLWEKSLVMLEQALALNDRLIEAQFLLAKAYYATGNWSKALENADICLRAGYRAGYCRRMKIKIAYRSRSYPRVCNQVGEGRNDLKPVRFYAVLRIEALARLGLKDEAEMELQRLLEKYRLNDKLKVDLQSLISNQNESEFAANYRSNAGFFKDRGYRFNEFETVKRKACRFLEEDLVYDNDTSRLLLAVKESGDCLLRINIKDSLLICDTDDVIIYQRMGKLLQEAGGPQKLETLAKIPVFVVEQQRENWELIMQLYDFNNLAGWTNLRFLIAPTESEFQQVFLDEHTVIPNVIYGTGVEEVKKQLSEVKMLRDQVNQTQYKM